MSCRLCRGFTLVEALVAILVLSFGMLGMLGLLLGGLKLTSSSNYRNIATLESQAMADQAKANARSLTSYNTPTASLDSSCFTSTGCSSAQTRTQTEYDLWQDRLAAMLPSGVGIICRDSTPADGTPGNWACDNTAQFVVKICWNESRVSIVSSNTCVQTNF